MGSRIFAKLRIRVPFKIKSDNKALATVLKGQKANKTYSSRFTRWVDWLLLFEFEVIYGPEKTLGIADYLSRNPPPQTDNSINANTLWKDWFTVNVVSEIKNSILANHQTIKETLDSKATQSTMASNGKITKLHETAIKPSEKRQLNLNINLVDNETPQ